MTTPNSLICKILGRNFEYDEALNIVQFEEYTEDINFDEIKRYDVQKRVRNLESQKLNFRKGRQHVGKNHRKHHGRNPREKFGKIPENEDNRRNKKEKVTNKVIKMITRYVHENQRVGWNLFLEKNKMAHSFMREARVLKMFCFILKNQKN